MYTLYEIKPRWTMGPQFNTRPILPRGFLVAHTSSTATHKPSIDCPMMSE